MTLGGNSSSKALHDSPRRLKDYTYSDDDRISNLPDSIIEHILSFLPTKYAVATGILSQRWKFLWTTVINLDFYCPGEFMGQRKPDFKINKFVRFVNYVLLHHRRECLNSFSLRWDESYDPLLVNAWISAALTKNLHQLSVDVGDCDLQIEAQRSIFSCEGLQSLYLKCKICFSNEIVTISLPKLQTLTLDSVYFRCVDEFSNLLAGCPVLKYLTIKMNSNVSKYFVDDHRDDIIYQVPRIIFSCEGLQSLELVICGMCIPENVISLPKLESLKLADIQFQSEEAFHKLIAGCPVIKYLQIHTDFVNHREEDDEEQEQEGAIVFRCRVFSDSLRHLDLSCSGYDYGTSLCSVELGAPSLVNIKLEDQITCIFIRESLSSLVEADISLDETNIEIAALESRHEDDYFNLFVEGFSGFHCVETLKLSRHVIWALSCARVNLNTRFKRLLKLEVRIGPCCWSSLQDFIELSDNLEALTVFKGSSCYGMDHHSRRSNWKNPNQVPNCISNSLKTFSLYDYDGSDDQLTMVGYLLKHGSALKVVKLSICSWSYATDFKTKFELVQRKFKLVQQIIKFPRMSTVCEVEVW